MMKICCTMERTACFTAEAVFSKRYRQFMVSSLTAYNRRKTSYRLPPVTFTAEKKSYRLPPKYLPVDYFPTIYRRRMTVCFLAIALKSTANMTSPFTARKRYRQHISYRLPFENYRNIALPSRVVTVFKTVTAVYPQIFTAVSTVSESS